MGMLVLILAVLSLACLQKCSRFGDMEMHTCSVCGPKPVSEFRKHHKRGYQNQCISCRRAYNRKHYRNNKSAYLSKAKIRNKSYKEEVYAEMIAYLTEHPCTVCGEDDLVVLEFHHTDREGKDAAVSRMIKYGRSWDVILLEIKKCIVLCANCHKREHAKECGSYRWLATNGL